MPPTFEANTIRRPHRKNTQHIRSLLWFRQRFWLLAGSTNRIFLCLLSCHKMELCLHFPLTVSEQVSQNFRMFVYHTMTVSLRVPSALQTSWKATSLLSASAERWRFSLSRLSTYLPCTTLLFWPHEGSHGGLIPPYLHTHRLNESKIWKEKCRLS